MAVLLDSPGKRGMTEGSIPNSFTKLVEDWVFRNITPDKAVEACTPAFTHRLGIEPSEFSFERYIHSSETPEWCLRTLDFPETLEGSFYLYVPANWSKSTQLKDMCQLNDGDVTRQSIFLTERNAWAQSLQQFYGQGEICAFAYYPVMPPHYHQWLVCMQSAGLIWNFAFYSGGPWLLITKGDANGRNSLETQLTSLINSRPWYAWIKNAS